MTDMPPDIYTEPDADPDTLRNLGPLAPMAGSWLGENGLDVHPTADGPVQSVYVERYELEPIDPQTNGIVTNPFLEYAFQTPDFEITVTIDDDGTWSYDQTTTLHVRGQSAPFLHTDRNTLKRIGKAQPNSLAATRLPPG